MKKNRYPQNLYDTVRDVLSENESARNSDVKLYIIILRKFYGTTDISFINLDGDIFASIKRARQKVQENYPELGPNDITKKFRSEVEQEYLDFVRNW